MKTALLVILTLPAVALGQLKLSPDSLYLTDQNGTPVFLSGDGGWDLITGPTLDQANLYLTDCASKGINYIQVRLITQKFTTYAPNNAYNIPPFNGAAFTNMNEAYFLHVDSVVNLAASKGIYLMLYPAYLGGDPSQGWSDQVGSTNQSTMRTYGRYLGQRYRSFPNILWGIGGDTDPTPWLSKLEAMVAGIRDFDNIHVMSTRDEPGTFATTHWPGRSWLNLNGFYPYWSNFDVQLVYEDARIARARTPRLPAVLQEAWYENEHGSTTVQLRQQAYYTVLGGAIAGAVFGNCPIWMFGQWSGSICGSSDWMGEMNSPGRTSMKWFGTVIRSRNWYKLIPDTNHVVMTAGYGMWGGADYVTAAYASDSTTIMAYMPSARQVTVNPAVLKGANIHVWWVNPATGLSSNYGVLTKQTRTYSQPGGGDWVLVMDAASMNYPAPGPPAGSPPPAPVLVSPANGAAGVSTGPTLTWNPSAGATSYYLQVSADPAFSTTAIDQPGLTATSYTASNLSGSTVYYWHVSAANANGTSSYSGAWSFTTVAAAPGIVVAAYSFDEGSGTVLGDKSGNNLRGTIVGGTWATGKYGGALSFNGSSSYVDLGNPSLLQLSGSATWSAWVYAAANPADDGIIIGKSDNSAGWQLKTSPDTGPVTFAVAVSGAAGSRTQRYSNVVRSLNTWYHVAGVYNAAAQTLDIYVNGVPDNGALRGTVPAVQVSPGVNVNIGRRTGGFYFSGLIDEVRIYNRALTQSEVQADMNTPIGTPATAPPAPVLVSPVNGAMGVPTGPTFSWNSSPGATSYHLQVSADRAFGSTAVDAPNLTTTSYTASGLTASSTYYWRVSASNSSGTSAYSPAWSFTTVSPPPAPVLASPANGATGVSTSPTLTWNASTGATSYRVQVSQDQGFATTVADQSNLTATSYTVNGLNGGTYYWHVNATSANGTSGYSALWSFTTAAAQTGGPVAAYAFDEGSGTTATDVTGHGINGTLTGATWAPGKYGSAVSLNGSSAYVDLGNPGLLQLTGSATWSAWVHAAANPADDGIIIAKSDNNTGWQLKTSPDTGPHTFAVSISGGDGLRTQRYSNTVRSLNRWYHLAGVYNAASQSLDIYVDGVLGNGVLRGTIPGAQTAPMVNTNIGRRTGGFYFNGLIDELRIYSRALSQAEIQADMNTPLGTPPPPPAVPLLSAPANGATGVSTSPTLAWNPSSGAASYHLQVSLDQSFGSTVLDQPALTTNSFTAAGLSANTTCYWRVNAGNSGGTSAYSTPWSFTTAGSTGLTAAYSFDEGSGTIARDGSGDGLQGTVIGAVWTSGGKYGSALSFDGSSAYVDLGNPSPLQLSGSATWSAWVYAAANPPDDGIIIGKSDNTTGWQLKTSPDTGPHTFAVAVSGGAGSRTQRYSNTIRSLNTWYNVAGVYNAAAQTLDIYVNGIHDNGVLRGAIPPSQVAPGANVNIGRRSGGFHFSGLIDEVRVYNRALSQSEVQADMNAQLGLAAPGAGPANQPMGSATQVASTDFYLSQNYPNPFNPATVVRYQVPVLSQVRVAVYDVLGREMAILYSGMKAPGIYEAAFNATGLSSGVYICRMTAGGFVESRLMSLTK